jgi:type IV secretion system protein VirB4
MMKVGQYHNRRRGIGSDIRRAGAWLNLLEYQDKPTDLTDLLPWGFLLEPGLIVNKDGSFLKVIGYRGPDLDSSSSAQLIAARGQMNNALRRLGSRWCIHFEAQRRPALSYPVSAFPERITAAIDAERREGFSKQTVPAFESQYFITFTYLAPEEKIGKAEAAIIENAQTTNQDSAYASEKTRFLAVVDNLTAILEGFMPYVKPLNDDELMTYLHSCISENSTLKVACPELPFAIDALLRDTPLLGGLQPQLGRLHMRTIGINSFPGRTISGLLDALNGLPFSYRWVTRYMPLDKQDAEKSIKTMQREWFTKRKGLMTLIKEGLTNQESHLEDGDALNKARQAGEALEVLGADLTSFGYFTSTITLADEDLERLDWQRRAVQQILDQQGLVSMLETTNAVEAWLSSLPGHAYANCRRPLLSALNVIDLMPFSAVWAGPEGNAHLKGPALLQCKTTGSTPFRLSLHHGDVGHTMVVGPTGAGKSVLLNMIALQFRRYPDSQVFIFDKGSSAKCATLLVGGQFYPMGDDEHPTTLQPLADIDKEDDRVWAADWLAGIITKQGVTLNPDMRAELWQALGNLATRPRVQRTLTVCRSLIQDLNMKAALAPFTLEGPHGSLLDAADTNIGDSDWQCFEMEALYNRPEAIGATLSYLFHRLEARFDGRPTMLLLDEAWLFLDDPIFAAKIREWLKVLRRRNVSVVFLSQSLADILNSSIAPALIENCFTRIFLPNNKALEPETTKLYDLFGLSSKQKQLISQATPKQDYYVQTPEGNRLFQLGLSRLAITVAGTSSRADLNEIDRIMDAFGEENFARAFLKSKHFNPDTLEDELAGEDRRELV